LEGVKSVTSVWDRYLTERDVRILELAGFGGRVGLGDRPVLLVVDVNDTFCGPEELPLETAVLRWRSSCGTAAWEAVRVIARLLAVGRAHGVPVIYTTGRDEPGGRGRWRDKVRAEVADRRPPHPYRINPLVAPQSGDLVLEKPKPSAFFATTLLARLLERGVDSVLVCGGTTSGCVRATVVDAFSYDLRVGVVAEATFDRCEASHALSLHDMAAKYADVIAADDAERQLAAAAWNGIDGSSEKR
jgi:maleamate amidohydrolase